MFTPRPRFHGFFALAAALLAFAACTDRNPAGLPAAESEPVLPPSSAAAVLKCTADVRAGTLACLPQGAETPAGVSATILGGQGTYVRLASSGTRYDGSSVFRTDVTVENLTSQALGTEDGTTPSPDGVRVFFHSGPTVTDGSGTVSVANPDGEGFFTASEQDYFQYDGILAPGDTTAAKEWRFTVPSTVGAFTFTVYVAADVRSEDGFVSLSPVAPSVMLGDTARLRATVRTVTGRALADEPVVWATSDSSVATVSSGGVGVGVVTGVAVGTATITASSGGRTASVTVQVTGDWLPPVPAIIGVDLPQTAVANGVDSVQIAVRVRARPGVPANPAINVELGPPNDTRFVNCSTFTLAGISGVVATYRCALVLPSGWRGGAWPVKSVTVQGQVEGRGIDYTGLQAAGAQSHVHVAGPDYDDAAPVLEGLVFPDSVTSGSTPIEVRMTASDPGAGVTSAYMSFRKAGIARVACTANTPAQGTRQAGTFVCQTFIREYWRGGAWEVDSVRLTDANGNVRRMGTADLVNAGFPAVMMVNSPNADTVPPAVTAFSFSPDTVTGNGVDSVTVSLSGSDEYSGVGFLDLRFSKPATGETKRCAYNVPTRPAPLTYTYSCALAFSAAEAGAWRVDFIRVVDLGGNVRLLSTAEMQAAGYPTELVVTPP